MLHYTKLLDDIVHLGYNLGLQRGNLKRRILHVAFCVACPREDVRYSMEEGVHGYRDKGKNTPTLKIIISVWDPWINIHVLLHKVKLFSLSLDNLQ